MRITSVTPMKNEGPYLLEWLAYHRLLGIDDPLVFTNDCSDGTDAMLERLDEMGLVRHLPNPSTYRGERNHHKHVMHYVNTFPRLRRSDWVLSFDADEFLAVQVGAGRLADLFDAVPEAQAISLNQRSFGCAGRESLDDDLQITQFTRAMPPDDVGKVGIKTLVRRDAPIERYANHAPVLSGRAARSMCWVNGAGEDLPPEAVVPMPKSLQPPHVSFRLAQINHYAVRSMDAFLVQAERGSATRPDSDQHLKYWGHYNQNAVEDLSAARRAGEVAALMAEWLGDAELRDLHRASFAWHRARIAHLRADETFARLRRQIARRHRRVWQTPAAEEGMAGPG